MTLFLYIVLATWEKSRNHTLSLATDFLSGQHHLKRCSTGWLISLLSPTSDERKLREGRKMSFLCVWPTAEIQDMCVKFFSPQGRAWYSGEETKLRQKQKLYTEKQWPTQESRLQSVGHPTCFWYCPLLQWNKQDTESSSLKLVDIWPKLGRCFLLGLNSIN